MTYAFSVAAICAGLMMTGAALAQTATDPAPAEAGAGAAAAVSGGAAPAAPPPAADAAAATTEEEAEVTKENGEIIVPSGLDLKPEAMENGRWYNAEGVPVPKIEADGTVDYATFSGYRRYHAECHVCHGPDGEGSTYAPALKKSAITMDYYDYMEVVASGRQVVSSSSNQVMPAFGTNRNVWCYVDDIWVYLVAHGTEQVGRGRPAKRADKSPEFTAQEDSCMAG